MEVRNYEALCAVWALFCYENNIENISADEVDTSEMSDAQKGFVKTFIDLWDKQF